MNQESRKNAVDSAGGSLRTIWLCLVVMTVVACMALPAIGASGGFVLHNTPSYVKTAKNLGPVDPASTIEVTLWLNPHNQAGLDALAKDLYDPKSPSFRHFLTPAQMAARFAPTAAEAATVRQFLEGQGLKIVRMGPYNFFVRARGTVQEVEVAFQVQLNRYEVLGKERRANDRDPFIDGAAASLVKAVYGLDNSEYEHPLMARPTSFGKSKAEIAAQSRSLGVAAEAAAEGNAASAASFFSNTCFGSESETLSTNGAPFPIGTYTGNNVNEGTSTSVGCGYTPTMIQAAYNLNAVYAAGFTGAGQTIGLLEGCNSLTIENDANAFSAMFGLPPLTSSNFEITSPFPSTCASADNVEVNIDVEWAHAIAPGANINLLIAPSNFLQDIDEVEFTAISFGLANVLSGSFGTIEAFTPTTLIETEGLLCEMAAVSGISANFSSGDNGDFTSFGLPPLVISPADSPFATAVGGITLALNPDNSIAWQAGWGNDEVLLAETGIVFDPPIQFGTIGGAGGGASNCVVQSFDSQGNETCVSGYAKPSFQAKLGGKQRLLPDVGWLADPFTGAVIAISIPGEFPPLVWQVFGGTSIATPMFSGLWAIANQAAGAPLGQAAPFLYSLPAGAITDIIPFGAKHNVTASIQTSATTADKFNANGLLGGDAPGKFVSAIWDFAGLQDTALVLSFGTNCSTVGPAEFFGKLCTDPTSLHTKLGWDNVTGVGVPNPTAFVNAFVPPPPPAAATVEK
jgi:subtilase family serine protease